MANLPRVGVAVLRPGAVEDGIVHDVTAGRLEAYKIGGIRMVVMMTQNVEELHTDRLSSDAVSMLGEARRISRIVGQ
jgi:hypothetical protein